MYREGDLIWVKVKHGRAQSGYTLKAGRFVRVKRGADGRIKAVVHIDGNKNDKIIDYREIMRRY